MECGSRMSSCVINMSPLELEVMAAACTLGPSAFLTPLVALISFEIPQPWGLHNNCSHSLHVHFLMEK